MKTYERDGGRSFHNLNEIPDDVWEEMRKARARPENEMERGSSARARCHVGGRQSTQNCANREKHLSIATAHLLAAAADREVSDTTRLQGFPLVEFDGGGQEVWYELERLVERLSNG